MSNREHREQLDPSLLVTASVGDSCERYGWGAVSRHRMPPFFLKGELWDRYQREAPAYRENIKTTQEGKQVMARCLGDARAERAIIAPLQPVAERAGTQLRQEL
jgi:hypothetical protein